MPIVVLGALGALTLASSAAAALEVPPAPNAPANAAAPDAPVKTLQYTRFVPSGVSQPIGRSVLALPDCTSAGVANAVISKGPAHGQLLLQKADEFPQYVENSARAMCNDKKLPTLKVMYQSANGFTGVDEAEIMLIFPDSTAASWHFTIKVMTVAGP